MTQPSPQTIEREKDKLYLTDAELIRRLGVPENNFGLRALSHCGIVRLSVIARQLQF